MKKMMKSLGSIAAMAVMAFALSACGGGGGGGGGGFSVGPDGVPVANTQTSAGAGSTGGGTGTGGASSVGDGSSQNTNTGPGSTVVLDPNFTTIDVSIALVFPQTFKFEMLEGARTTPQDFLGGAQGNLSLLNGKSVYIYIEDPDHIFLGVSRAELIDNTLMRTKMAVNEQLARGRYSGQFNVYACLDVRCAVRFKNTPYSVPYDVKVNSSPRFVANDSKSIDIRTTFSLQEKKISVPIKPAEGKYYFQVNSPLVMVRPKLEFSSAVITRRELGGEATFDITLPPMLNGGQYKLVWDAFQPSSKTEGIMTINLTVDPDPAIPFAIWKRTFNYIEPATSINISASVSQQTIYAAETLILAAGEGNFVYEGHVFLNLQGNPIPAPVAEPWYKLNVFHSEEKMKHDFGWGWSTTVALNACNVGGDPNARTCFAPGEYPIQLRFRYELNGNSQPVYFPVKVIITP